MEEAGEEVLLARGCKDGAMVDRVRRNDDIDGKLPMSH